MLTSPRSGLRIYLAAALCGSLLGCGAPTQGPLADGVRAREAATAAPRPRLHAVLVNGGGRPQINFYSHLDHLRRLLGLLDAAAVPADRIAVFSADGADPAPDLATRDGEGGADEIVLPRALARSLRPVAYEDSRIDGVTLRPATRAALERWFIEEGSRLVLGDVLLFYVTDHGERGSDAPTDNTITLWGESLDVEGLRALLALLDPEVRVVLVMSQCYSGGFAQLILPGPGDAAGHDNLCGYFSTTADRPAHGCYPEVSGKPAVGHSHRLFAALAQGVSLAEAQREVLVSDSTPDVPNATRGLFLERRVQAAADAAGLPLPALADSLLAQALENPLAWEPELRLLDRVATAYGFASPRSLQALDAQAAELEHLSERLSTYADLWERALDSLRDENLGALRAAHPDWGARLESRTLRTLDDDERRRLREELVDALERTATEDSDRLERIRELQRKAEASRAARYRAEVRLGVVLRMRALLLEIAGRYELANQGETGPQDRYRRLEACEDLALAPLPEAPSDLYEAEPFPTLAEERRRLSEIVPGWLGIRYRPPRQAERREGALPAGAVVVSSVLPKTPASDAGIEVGDILVGTPDTPFSESHGIREWTMLGEIGRSHPLLVLREGEEREVWIRLASYPLELPELPGPPEVGSVAPALELEPLYGAVLPARHEPRLLFFWASWCSHCKAALPEVLAFSKSQRIPVIAITDETAEEVEAFLAVEPEAGELRLATDRKRRSFERYGVSGTPTFVWVDESGIVRHYQRGYDASKGLELDRWRVDGAGASP